MVDILELKDRLMLLYDRAQLDGDNSELDALKRLALSHDGLAASVASSEETSPLPTLPFSVPHHSSRQSTKNTVATTAVTLSAERKIKVESASSERPVSAKSAKLLLIPGSLSSATKQHTVTTPSLFGTTESEWKHEPIVAGHGVTGKAKRRSQSDGISKSVPLGDVMNVRSASAHAGRRSLISLVPLSTATAPPTCSSGKSEWSPQVRIKPEPGLLGPPAGKRKLPMVTGVFTHCLYF